ncbi:putative alpha-1,3-glucanase [Colletotrichum tofieldiae]|nr:putative alpha-1,3-glucanase [Colletotrichum tofieldiae]
MGPCSKEPDSTTPGVGTMRSNRMSRPQSTGPLPVYTTEFSPIEVEPVVEPLDNRCPGGNCLNDDDG